VVLGASLEPIQHSLPLSHIAADHGIAKLDGQIRQHLVLAVDEFNACFKQLAPGKHLQFRGDMACSS
jgi:hypothetical protein